MIKHCFLKDGRPCGEDCMAFSGVNQEDNKPKCLLLSLGAQLISLLRGGTKHPKSAPPPEVR